MSVKTPKPHFDNSGEKGGVAYGRCNTLQYDTIQYIVLVCRDVDYLKANRSFNERSATHGVQRNNIGFAGPLRFFI